MTFSPNKHYIKPTNSHSKNSRFSITNIPKLKPKPKPKPKYEEYKQNLHKLTMDTKNCQLLED